MCLDNCRLPQRSEKGQCRQPVLPRKKRTQLAASEGANSLTILKNGREAYVSDIRCLRLRYWQSAGKK